MIVGGHRHVYRKPEPDAIFKFCRVKGCKKRKKISCKPKAKTLRNKCDAAWARVTKMIHIKKHGPICLWCRKVSALQSDHIINRWKTATRWNPSNCICLCAPDHLFRKKREPLAWANLVRENVPAETLEALEAASKELVKNPNYEAILSGLLSMERELAA